MEGAYAASILEEFSPLSKASITANLQNASFSTAVFYITIDTENCFKTFASKYFEGVGEVGLSAALDEIHGRKHYTIFSILLLITLTQCAIQRKKKHYFLEVLTTST